MKTKEKDIGNARHAPAGSHPGPQAVRQDKSDLAKDSGPQKDIMEQPGGSGKARQQAGGVDHHGGDPHEDRNP